MLRFVYKLMIFTTPSLNPVISSFESVVIFRKSTAAEVVDEIHCFSSLLMI